MLSEGHNLGVFQLSEGWVKGILRDIKPDSFGDVVALNALVRPGSTDNAAPKDYARRKRSGNRRPDIHPEVNQDFAPLLERSYGIVLYQEDVLAIIAETTGWGYAEADLLFNAFRKKDLEKLHKAKPGFSDASKYSDSATQRIWDILEPFADYSFNRSHATGYGLISYQTAYLKANFPREFISAMMSYEEDQDQIQKCIQEANRLGIAVLPPDVNASGIGFTPTKEGIRYGLGAIKGLGPAAISGLLDRRPFQDIDDFFRRADQNMLNIRVLGALARGGAFEDLYPGRTSLVREVERLSQLAGNHRRFSTFGERPLFRIRYEPRIRVPDDRDQLASDETELLGVRLTFPKIILKTDRALSGSEMAWLRTVLDSRMPESEVCIESHGLRITLDTRSAERGLARAVASIGLRVELE